MRRFSGQWQRSAEASTARLLPNIDADTEVSRLCEYRTSLLRCTETQHRACAAAAAEAAGSRILTGRLARCWGHAGEARRRSAWHRGDPIVAHHLR